MKTYTGTKVINAKPMTRLAYNDLRGWVVPADEDGNDEGYLVEYTDGGRANVHGFTGYVSWSPKDVFERTYKELDPNRAVCAKTCATARVDRKPCKCYPTL